MIASAQPTQPDFQLSASQLNVRGEWSAQTLPGIQKSFTKLLPTSGRLVVDGAELDGLDSAGAWLLARTFQHWRDAGTELTLTGFQSAHTELLELVQTHGHGLRCASYRWAVDLFIGRGDCLSGWSSFTNVWRNDLHGGFRRSSNGPRTLAVDYGDHSRWAHRLRLHRANRNDESH